jgi:hypothetical protein
MVLNIPGFLDYLVRQWPSQAFLFIKGNVATPLDNVSLLKGYLCVH